MQRRAAKKLYDLGDIEGWKRYVRLEVSLRQKVLEDIEKLDTSESALREERNLQFTYLIQALDWVGEDQAIHDFLIKKDVKNLSVNSKLLLRAARCAASERFNGSEGERAA